MCRSMRKNTDAVDRGGAARSSDEVPVMGMERRGSAMASTMRVN